MGRAPDCRSGGRGFDTRRSRQFILVPLAPPTEAEKRFVERLRKIEEIKIRAFMPRRGDAKARG